MLITEVDQEVKAVSWNRHRMRWTISRLCASVFRACEVRLLTSYFGKLPVPCRTTRSLFGRSMHLDLARSSAQQLLYLMGPRALHELILYQQHVKPGMTVVDVGSNIGYHVLLFESLVGATGKIIAIEPSPENLPELEANIKNNNLRNVSLHKIAVGATQSTVQVKSGINSGICTDDSEGIAAIPMQQLDEVATEKVDFIKIDVDGYELEVLQGSLQVLERDRPTVLVEVHPHILPRFGNCVQNVIDVLSPYYSKIEGFDHFRAKDESVIKRVLRRYVAPHQLKKIENLNAVIAEADANQHDWTFWIVASNDLV